MDKRGTPATDRGACTGRRRARVAVAAAALAGVLLSLASAPRAGERFAGVDDAAACNGAIAIAQATHGIPDGLLGAIARTESGRADPMGGGVVPWPWTINANGAGQFFATRQEAVAAVLRLQERGVQSIDVGCMQINLRSHPDAFATLDDAFDPQRNAAYGARFLVALYGRSGTWMGAAMAYHSQTPELAAPYGARVAAAWGAGADDASVPGVRAPAPTAGPDRFEPGTMFAVALPAAFRAPLPLALPHRRLAAGPARPVVRVTVAAR